MDFSRSARTSLPYGYRRHFYLDFVKVIDGLSRPCLERGSEAALGGAVHYGSVGNDPEKDDLLKQANCPDLLSKPLSS